MSILSAYRELRNDIKEREAFKQKVWANKDYIRATDFLIEDDQVSCEAYNKDHYRKIIKNAKYIAMRLGVKSIHVTEYRSIKYISIKPKSKYLNPKGLLKLVGIPLLIILLIVMTIFNIQAQEYYTSTSVKILDNGVVIDPLQYEEKIDSMIIDAGDRCTTIEPYHTTYKNDSVIHHFTKKGKWVESYLWTHSFENNNTIVLFNFINKGDVILMFIFDELENRNAWSLFIHKTITSSILARTEIVKEEP